MDELFDIISHMEPEEALSEITRVLGRLLQDLDNKARERFLMTLVGQSEGDKVSGMVHLWLAECMGEGVDPTQMCQSLVEKVARSKQLMAIAEPELLVLFEDWLEELELEAHALIKAHGSLDEKSLADKLGLSRRGAAFLLSKLERKQGGSAENRQGWWNFNVYRNGFKEEIYMAELIVFHSGNPAWVSCRKAIGVANEMEKKFAGKLDVKIYTMDSEEAKPYALEFKGSTNVLLNKEWVPLKTAIETSKMEEFLAQHL